MMPDVPPNQLDALRHALWRYALDRQVIREQVPIAYQDNPNKQGERPNKLYASTRLNLFFSGGGGAKRISSSSHELYQNFTWAIESTGAKAEEAYAIIKTELTAAMLLAADELKKTVPALRRVDVRDTVDDDKPESRRPGWIGVLSVAATLRYSAAQLKQGA